MNKQNIYFGNGGKVVDLCSEEFSVTKWEAVWADAPEGSTILLMVIEVDDPKERLFNCIGNCGRTTTVKVELLGEINISAELAVKEYWRSLKGVTVGEVKLTEEGEGRGSLNTVVIKEQEDEQTN